MLSRFGYDDPLLHAAAWLHDVLEDTSASRTDILVALGGERQDEDVVRIVCAVTDEPGATRDERKAKTYPKIVAAGDRAITLKLADRIANVEAALMGYHRFLPTYQCERASFAAALRSHGGDTAMWCHLDNLLSWR